MELKLMIDWEITTASTGKDKEYFMKNSHSNKKVYAMCQMCGHWRWTEYRLSHKLCRSCASKRNKND